MSQPTAETRDDVMRTSNLHTLLCERTAADYRLRWEKQHARTPVAGLIAFFVIGCVLWTVGLREGAWIFWLLTAIYGAILVWSTVSRALSRVAEVQDRVLRGEFPAMVAPHVLSRLRWWNHLIAPHQWARHSRIHERRSQLEQRLREVEQEIVRVQEESEEAEARLGELSGDHVAHLAARINTLAARLTYETRMATLHEELPRLQEKRRLYAALLHKVTEVTDKLARIEKLGITVGEDAGMDLSELARRACQALEERRRLVRTVDEIDPGDFLELVKV